MLFAIRRIGQRSELGQLAGYVEIRGGRNACHPKWLRFDSSPDRREGKDLQAEITAAAEHAESYASQTG